MNTKERPILYSAPMVLALLDDTKTQTRRIVKPQPFGVALVESGNHIFDYRSDLGDHSRLVTMEQAITLCPYGLPGDRLWVRENGWERPHRTPRMLRQGSDTWKPYCYDADGISDKDAADFKAWGFKRRPSIHMPRWASRITLEVTRVRVERLRSISEADALAEGIVGQADGGFALSDTRHYSASPVTSYLSLWESIHGAGSIEQDPWVWVIEFKRI